MNCDLIMSILCPKFLFNSAFHECTCEISDKNIGVCIFLFGISYYFFLAGPVLSGVKFCISEYNISDQVHKNVFASMVSLLLKHFFLRVKFLQTWSSCTPTYIQNCLLVRNWPVLYGFFCIRIVLFFGKSWQSEVDKQRNGSLSRYNVNF